MQRPRASAVASRPAPATPAEVAPLPAELWILRNRRTGQWVSAHQEGLIINRAVLVAAASPSALDESIAFYSRFCNTEVEPHRVL